MKLWPVAEIRDPWLRKPAVLIVFTAGMLWHFNWRLIAFPLSVAWEACRAAVEAGTMAGRDSISADLNCRAVRLLRVGFAKAWSGELAIQPQAEGEG